MSEAANIREWRGNDVVDAQGHKIGRLEAVYVDTASDLPSFGTVTTVAAHAPSDPTGRQPGCATQQNKPGKTSQSGLYAH